MSQIGGEGGGAWVASFAKNVIRARPSEPDTLGLRLRNEVGSILTVTLAWPLTAMTSSSSKRSADFWERGSLLVVCTLVTTVAGTTMS